MAYVTPLERRVLMDVYNMTDANIAALDPGIAEHLISAHAGGLVYDIIADDPDKPVIATTLGELRAQDFVDAASELPRRVSEGLEKTVKWTSSLVGRAAEAIFEEAGTGLIVTAAAVGIGFWYMTRK